MASCFKWGGGCIQRGEKALKTHNGRSWSISTPPSVGMCRTLSDASMIYSEHICIHTFRDEHKYWRRLSIRCAACIVSRISVVSFPDREAALCLRTWFCLYCNSSTSCVVVDHPFIVVPEHVLRRLWALYIESRS